jgi:hypothetical protein
LWACFRLHDKRQQKDREEQDEFCEPSVHAGDQENLRGNLVSIRARF